MDISKWINSNLSSNNLLNQNIVSKIKDIFSLITNTDIIDNLTFHFNNVSSLENLKCTISCIILTYNEERCILRCLESVLNYFDEIIIIDSGSTDKTLEIVKEINNSKISIYQIHWENDFAKARNFGIEKAKSDWIVFIDADEELQASNCLKEFLSVFMFCQQKERLVFSFCIKERNYPNIYDDVHRMILKNGTCNYFGNVHEEIRNSNNNIIMIKTKIILYHDGYNTNILIEKDKINRNLNLLLIMQKKEPSNLRWIYFYLRDGLNTLSSKKMLNIIQNNILICKEKGFVLNNLKNKRYVFEILKIYFELLMKLMKYNDIVELSKQLITIYPDDYDLTYYYYLSKALNTKILLLNDMKNLMEFRKQNQNRQNSLINNQGFHIDLVLGLLTFETMNYTQSKKYFNFVKEKLKGSYNDNLINTYLSVLDKF